MVESNVERGASGIGQNLLVSFTVALIVLETAFVAATAFLAGCASVPRDSGFAEVQRAVVAETRQPVEWDRTPNPILPISLSSLGKSLDGVTINLSPGELLDVLPRLMAECVLPMVDLAPS